MILAVKYLVRINTSGEFQFESLLEVKDFLRHINAAIASNAPIRVYKVSYELNTSTHYVSKTETELTQW